MQETAPHIQADAERISSLGGPTKVAELLGFDKAQGGVQRVQNWITRGIPSKVKLSYPEIFLKSVAHEGPRSSGEGA